MNGQRSRIRCGNKDNPQPLCRNGCPKAPVTFYWTYPDTKHLILKRSAAYIAPMVTTIHKNREGHMKNWTALCLLGLISLGISTIAQAQQAAGTAKMAVAALEDQWTQSQRTNNPDLVAPLLADKFIGIGTDGKISNREKDLADAKATKFASVDIEDLHITVFGNTAVATMVFKAKGTDEKGKSMDINARWADTWVKMPSGAWQCVLSQGSGLKQ
jgi:ketosteroid isomerase-like protein